MLPKCKFYTFEKYLFNGILHIKTQVLSSRPQIIPTYGKDLDLLSFSLKVPWTPNKTELLMAHLWVDHKS